ncbi:hypothetical protein Scep_009821 [Stephania cephalantha]|uniref:Uncharacterized protein n=1 Tax=Stephania cephalantha TaxID=152367 RepID=A0AAP0PGI6_9MAGN
MKPHIPDFKLACEHFCINAGGRWDGSQKLKREERCLRRERGTTVMIQILRNPRGQAVKINKMYSGGWQVVLIPEGKDKKAWSRLNEALTSFVQGRQPQPEVVSRPGPTGGRTIRVEGVRETVQQHIASKGSKEQRRTSMVEQEEHRAMPIEPNRLDTQAIDCQTSLFYLKNHGLHHGRSLRKFYLKEWEEMYN